MFEIEWDGMEESEAISQMDVSLLRSRRMIRVRGLAGHLNGEYADYVVWLDCARGRRRVGILTGHPLCLLPVQDRSQQQHWVIDDDSVAL